MKLQITHVDETLHRLAKTIAAHQGHSLNKFIIDAIRNAVLRAGLSDPAIRTIIDREAGIDREGGKL